MRRRWFAHDGQAGDRTLAEQLAGLEKLREAMPGATVLDLGCAEGLLAREFLSWGARRVDGVEIVPEAVVDARAVLADAIREGRASVHRGSIMTLDALDTLDPQYDIVCALAVVQKVERCDLALAAIARRARDLLVLRNPPERGPVIATERQRGALAIEAHDIAQHAQETRTEQIASLRKDGIKIGAGPFEHAGARFAGQRQLDRERHIGRAGMHIELFEELD